MTKEALTQLREVHAIQGRDGCWDIDDYMLGLYNGLELALSIVENRACKYKQRPKSQPEQEPVAWEQFHEHMAGPNYVAPQRTWVRPTDEEIWKTISRIGTSDSDVNPYAKLADARAIEAKLRSKNNV